jgi:RNA polymerase sigma factor (sigma-70 family)
LRTPLTTLEYRPDRLPTHEENLKYIKAAQEGSEEALDTMIRYHHRLVYPQVQRYKHVMGAEEDDLIQVGLIGLTEAVERYNPEEGTQFSTFAISTIKGAMRNYLRNQGTVRVPAHLYWVIQRIKQAGVVNEPEEVIKELVGEHNAYYIKHACHFLKNHMHQLSSLDQTVNNAELGGSDTTLQEFIPDEIDSYQDVENRLAFEGVIHHLTEKERFIIRERYYNEKTLREIGEIVGVSRERIRQIESKALKTLKRLLEDDKMAVDPKAKEQAIKLLSETELTYAEIKEKTGCALSSINYWAKTHRDPKVIEKNRAEKIGNRGRKNKKEQKPESKSYNARVKLEPFMDGAEETIIPVDQRLENTRNRAIELRDRVLNSSFEDTLKSEKGTISMIFDFSVKAHGEDVDPQAAADKLKEVSETIEKLKVTDVTFHLDLKGNTKEDK